ncbi:NfeD family protein [uncultured Umboniibacter sp.]|uniref:NfeD family protein n=1 Tax=uncultured Umboniibacter sp. TaxID=1798917 RepID=UPI002622D35A|nr:NfeD family protein [uncultured Umboniibacter sp.]
MDIEILWWHWIVLAGALIALELLGAAGFLMGIAVAALGTGLLVALIPIGWELQLLAFAPSAALLSFLYIKRFKSFNEKTDRPQLNNRLAQLIGHEGSVVNVGAASVKIQIGDSLWSVVCDESLEVGDKVVITAFSGDTLQAKKACH